MLFPGFPGSKEASSSASRGEDAGKENFGKRNLFSAQNPHARKLPLKEFPKFLELRRREGREFLPWREEFPGIAKVLQRELGVGFWELGIGGI